jgi:hypothetical protein
VIEAGGHDVVEAAVPPAGARLGSGRASAGTGAWYRLAAAGVTGLVSCTLKRLAKGTLKLALLMSALPS